MLSNKELIKKWDEIPFYGGGYKRIDNTHPIEWYIGYEDMNQKTILLLTNNDPGNISSSKSIIASTGQRKDGRWAISFRLIKKGNEDVFIHLCWDIIESSRDKSLGCDTVDYIVERYNKWLKLMEHQRPELMDDTHIKGLIGEMLFLEENIKNGMELQVAVDGWIGPDGADQDFVYVNGWTEIKCIGISTNSISISSIEQLDAELPGWICVYFLDKTAPENTKGFTLVEKIEELRSVFANNVRAREVFENKLFKYGYSDRKEYNEQRYKFGGKKKYKVDDDFPRLIKSNIPFEIISAKYNISLAGIEGWRLK
ncbi:hypothetical protein GCM10008905_08330 [Clostridium malenominatum]|uniref:PD-(D/E)XK motif protein n=1 Tax=Clostridium malenominatum TaxID=1539 RepID=A0ABN1IRS6_9CLOT